MIKHTNWGGLDSIRLGASHNSGRGGLAVLAFMHTTGIMLNKPRGLVSYLFHNFAAHCHNAISFQVQTAPLSREASFWKEKKFYFYQMNFLLKLYANISQNKGSWAKT